jgi:hypothetical protein
VKESDLMKLNEMCEIAYKMLAEDELEGIYLIKDVGDSLVFFGGNPDEEYYGIRTVSVNKETGMCKWFEAHYNLEILKAAKVLNVPERYMYKAPYMLEC